MRIVLLTGGLFILTACGLSVWMNAAGGYVRTPALCGLGLCDAELLEQTARIAVLIPQPAANRAAVTLFGQILERDSASPYTWMETASALQLSGDGRRARACVAQALRLAPQSVPLRMRALHFYVADQAQEDVFSVGRSILQLTPAYDGFIFAYYAQSGRPATEALAKGVPDARSSAAWLAYVMASPDPQPAADVWAAMEDHGQVNNDLVADFTDFLIRSGQIGKSAEVWEKAFSHSGMRKAGNLLYNPEFHRPFSRGLYDWKFGETPGVAISVEPTGVLRIDFAGESNVNFHQVSQVIPVSPGPFRLQARVRADGISTDEGPFIELADREKPARFLFDTAKLTGTSGWQDWDYHFTVPPGTRLVELAIVRRPSLKFDNKLAGTVRFARLTLAGPGPRGAAR